MNAYFVKCNSCVKDENGNITEIHCTYDPASKGGNSPDGRKVKELSTGFQPSMESR